MLQLNVQAEKLTLEPAFRVRFGRSPALPGGPYLAHGKNDQ
jgi:hypothetical protein